MSKPADKVSRVGRSRFQWLYCWMRPRSGTRARHHTRDFCTPTRSHPRKRARRRAEEGSPWDLTPETRMDRHRSDAPSIGSTVASRKRVPAPRCADPCSTLRRAGHCGCNPSGWHEFLPMTLSPSLTIFAILSASGFASWAKIVTAPHADHDVRHSKNCRKARSSPAGFAPIQAGARRDRRAAAVRRRAAATPS
jgi:hypothetical protein